MDEPVSKTSSSSSSQVIHEVSQTEDRNFSLSNIEQDFDDAEI